MNKIFLSFSVIILLLITSQTFGCSCNWIGNFKKSAPISGDIIIKGKVTDRTYYFDNGAIYKDLDKGINEILNEDLDANVNFRESITIEIIEIIWGKEERKKIEVFGSDGADCRASVRHFNFGDYYIFSFYKLSKEASLKSSETNNGYAIHGCGENYLKYNQENNTVFGRIKGKSIRKKNKIYSYKKFLEILK